MTALQQPVGLARKGQVWNHSGLEANGRLEFVDLPVCWLLAVAAAAVAADRGNIVKIVRRSLFAEADMYGDG